MIRRGLIALSVLASSLLFGQSAQGQSSVTLTGSLTGSELRFQGRVAPALSCGLGILEVNGRPVNVNNPSAGGNTISEQDQSGSFSGIVYLTDNPVSAVLTIRSQGGGTCPTALVTLRNSQNAPVNTTPQAQVTQSPSPSVAPVMAATPAPVEEKRDIPFWAWLVGGVVAGGAAVAGAEWTAHRYRAKHGGKQ